MFVKGISTEYFPENWVRDCPTILVGGAHKLFRRLSNRFASEGSPIYLLKLGSKFLRTKSFCLKTVFLLAFGLGMCEGVGEDSRHGIGHVDIQV